MIKYLRIERNRIIKDRLIEVDVNLSKHRRLKALSYPLSLVTPTDGLLAYILERRYKAKKEIRGYGYNPYLLLTIPNPYYIGPEDTPYINLYRVSSIR